MEPDLGYVQRVAVVVLNLSVSVLVGAGAASLWLSQARSAWTTALLPRLRMAMFVCLATALVADVAVLWFEAASMAEVAIAEAFPAIESVITATHYGSAWMLGAGALLVALVVAVVGPRAFGGRSASLMGLAALGVFLYSRSMVSHAGAAGDFTWAVGVDWVHLVLTSLWVGAVLVAGFIVLREEPGAGHENRLDCACYVEALSSSATVALAGIIVTGLVSAWRGLGSVDQVFGNPYGNMLLIKAALVLCAAALGGMNRFVVMPALLARIQVAPVSVSSFQSGAGSRFARVLQVESVVLLAVMIAAAILSSTPPPTAS